MGETKVTRRSFVKGVAGLGAAVAIGSTTEKSGAATITNKTNNASIGKSLKKGKVFKDSLGRQVKLPEKISSIVPSGKYAEAVIMTLCPDKLASITEPLDAGEKQLFRRAGMSKVNELPESGEMYASESRDGNNNLSVSSIKKTKPDIVLDVGTRKNDLRSNISFLQSKSGVPVVFIDGSFGNLANVYRTLGSLVGYESRAEILAEFIEQLYKSVAKKRGRITDVINVYYAKNDCGRYSNSGYSFQNKAIEYVGANPVSIAPKSEKNLIDIGDIQKQKIDYVLFNDRECLDGIMNDEHYDGASWNSVEAVCYGNYALAPSMFHNWIGFPLFAQTIGLVWIGSVLWPELYMDDIGVIISKFYRIFYSYNVSEKRIIEMLFGAIE